MTLQEEAEQLFMDAGARLSGLHVVYVSEKHGDEYVNKDIVFQPGNGKVLERLCHMLADVVAPFNPEVLLGPKNGGAKIAARVAEILSSGPRFVIATHADKPAVPHGPYVIPEGQQALIRGRRTFVIEDIVNSGETVMSAVQAAQACGGDVQGIAAWWNRHTCDAASLGVPHFAALVNRLIESWEEAECPMCAAGVPISTQVGKGKEYLRKKGLL